MSFKQISPSLGAYDTGDCLLGYNDHFLVIVALQITRNNESLGDLYSLEYRKKKKKKKLEAKKDLKV